MKSSLCQFVGPSVSLSQQVSFSSAGSEADPVSPSWSYSCGEVKMCKSPFCFRGVYSQLFFPSVHLESLKYEQQVSFNNIADDILLLKVFLSQLALNSPRFRGLQEGCSGSLSSFESGGLAAGYSGVSS